MIQKKVQATKICKVCEKDFIPRQSNVLTCPDCILFFKQKSPCKCGCGKLVRNASKTGCVRKSCRIKDGVKIEKRKLSFRLSKICIICNKPFLARQANTNRCLEHALDKKGLCKCGCGREALINKSGYAHGCKNRGKKYSEIYKDKVPKNGFKKGLLNPNYTTPQFQRFKLKSPNKRGELFRSTLEARFSNLCHDNYIDYDYEVRIPLCNRKVKVVDFSLDYNEILIEITGYSYDKWQRDFDSKFSILKQTVKDVPIIILTYPDKKELVHSRNIDRDVFIESIDNEEGILKKIALFRSINFSNKHILNETVYF